MCGQWGTDIWRMTPQKFSKSSLGPPLGGEVREVVQGGGRSQRRGANRWLERRRSQKGEPIRRSRCSKTGMLLVREMEGFVWTRRELGLQEGKKSTRGEKPRYLGHCCLGAAPSTTRQLEGHHLWGSRGQ